MFFSARPDEEWSPGKMRQEEGGEMKSDALGQTQQDVPSNFALHPLVFGAKDTP